MPRKKTVAEIHARLKEIDRKASEKKKALKDELRRAASAEKRADRKRDTRKKVLLGAMQLEKMNQSAQYRAAQLRELDRFLTRPTDRELFGLNSQNTNNDDTLVG
jgi:hypothetical protein